MICICMPTNQSQTSSVIIFGPFTLYYLPHLHLLFIYNHLHHHQQYNNKAIE